ncbi:MAG: hypothetical protein ACYDDW_19095 [Dermatophilaceae bacterium]
MSLSGKSITISLRPADVPAVQAALERYRVKQEILQEQASRGVATLRARNARR